MMALLSQTKTRISLIAALVCTAVLIAALGSYLFEARPRPAIDPSLGRMLEPPVAVPPFQLNDQEGKSFGADRLQGQWTLAMIGFTSCPDVCPLSLAMVSEFMQQLEPAKSSVPRPQFLFVTVDPYRDTTAVLADYVRFYDSRFIALTGSPKDIFHLTGSLELFYAYVGPNDSRVITDVLQRPATRDYTVIHSADLLFISPHGRVVFRMSQPFQPADIRHVYTQLHTAWEKK